MRSSSVVVLMMLGVPRHPPSRRSTGNRSTPQWADRAWCSPGNVHRFNFPRSDMHVTAGGVQIKPSFALGGMGRHESHPPVA